MSASLVRHDSQAKPGGTVTYSIWVWSTVKSRQVSVTVSANGRHIDKPQYTLCPAVHRTTCSIGSLPAYQALEVLVTDHIRKKATSGEAVGLTVVVQGVARSPSGGPLSPAEAAVSTVLSQSGSSPTVPTTGSFPSVPSGPAGLPGTTVTPPGDITSLFPVVTPSPTPSAARKEEPKVTKATSTASSLPLDPRLIGGQLAGLAVLAAAITMVIARLSLRTPQLASAPEPAQTAAAAPPPQPITPDTQARATSSEAADNETDPAAES